MRSGRTTISSIKPLATDEAADTTEDPPGDEQDDGGATREGAGAGLLAGPKGSRYQRPRAPSLQRPWTTRTASEPQTINGCGGDAFHGAVIPDNSGGAPLCFGIHRAVGGDHDYPNPGDLLSAALAACFDSTLRMVADHLGVRLQFVEVKVEVECDVRGCLMVERSVPVGFQRMRCNVRLQR